MDDIVSENASRQGVCPSPHFSSCSRMVFPLYLILWLHKYATVDGAGKIVVSVFLANRGLDATLTADGFDKFSAALPSDHGTRAKGNNISFARHARNT